LAVSAWDGQWTDNSGLGFNQYICADDQGRTFSSIYSEAGVLVGNLTNNYRAAKGNWYEAGIGDCTSGTFEIYLSVDGKSFSGLYTCGDAPGSEIPIFETLVDPERPTDVECGNFPRTVQTVDGKWLATFVNTQFDICTDGNKLFASFEETSLISLSSIPAVSSPSSSSSASSSSSSSSPVSSSSSSSGSSDTVSVAELIASGANIITTRGYSYGYVYEYGNVWKYFGTLEDGSHFVLLGVRQNTRTTTIYFYCAYNKFSRAQSAAFDTSCHGSFPVTRQTTTVTKKECSRNVFLAPPETVVSYSYTPASSKYSSLFSSLPSSSSGASNVVVSVSIVLMAVVAACFAL